MIALRVSSKGMMDGNGIDLITSTELILSQSNEYVRKISKSYRKRLLQILRKISADYKAQ